jgi:crossover junction endodeoxyribonuclease RusA
MTNTGLPTPHTGLAFFVPGVPVAQGSKRHVGRGVMVESSKHLQPWRDSVISAALRVGENVRFHGPVEVKLDFTFPRPANHYGTGRNAGILKKTSPEFKQSAPDIDKLARAVLDALVQAGLLQDDALVVLLHAEKRYSDRPGARVVIRHA